MPRLGRRTRLHADAAAAAPRAETSRAADTPASLKLFGSRSLWSKHCRDGCLVELHL